MVDKSCREHQRKESTSEEGLHEPDQPARLLLAHGRCRGATGGSRPLVARSLRGTKGRAAIDIEQGGGLPLCMHAVTMPGKRW